MAENFVTTIEANLKQLNVNKPDKSRTRYSLSALEIFLGVVNSFTFKDCSQHPCPADLRNGNVEQVI